MHQEFISRILYRHDPAHTGCNLCEGMEDEYDRVAGAIARIPSNELSLEVLREVLERSFFAGAIGEEDLMLCYLEIRRRYPPHRSADARHPTSL